MERYENTRREEVRGDQRATLHDDLVHHAGQKLLELLERLALGGLKDSPPEQLELMTDFPRTLPGKIQKYALRREIEGR